MVDCIVYTTEHSRYGTDVLCAEAVESTSSAESICHVGVKVMLGNFIAA